MVDTLDRQPKIQHPGGKHLAQDATRLLDIEDPSRRRFEGHRRIVPRRASAAFRAQALVRHCLKIAGLGPYDGGWWGEVFPNVSPSGSFVLRDRGCARPQWLHQMRPDL